MHYYFLVINRTTLTLITKTTSTTTLQCSDFGTAVVTPDPTSTIEEPPLSTSDTVALLPRQALSTGWLTTTSYGPLPPYATRVCDVPGYTSACSCEGITQTRFTLLSTVWLLDSITDEPANTKQ